MGYEQAKFGDGSASGSGNVTTAVNQHYGERDTGKTTGVIKTEGAMNELTLHLDGDMASNEAFALVAPTLPAYSRIEDVFWEVEEAFVLGGTSPVIEVGTEGTEATNGVTITESQAETVGVYDLTSALAGTWAGTVGLTAETTVGIALGGTSPTSTSAGKAKLVIRYVKV